MGFVYRYIDKEDNIIKYVGIVYGKTRTLKNRIEEHKTQDWWAKGNNFRIEYLKENINTRTDAEYFEAHYISLYNTDKWYNKAKANWGISSFLPDREKEWIEYIDPSEKNKDDKTHEKPDVDLSTFVYYKEQYKRLIAENNILRIKCEEYEKCKENNTSNHIEQCALAFDERTIAELFSFSDFPHDFISSCEDCSTKKRYYTRIWREKDSGYLLLTNNTIEDYQKDKNDFLYCDGVIRVNITIDNHIDFQEHNNGYPLSFAHILSNPSYYMSYEPLSADTYSIYVDLLSTKVQHELELDSESIRYDYLKSLIYKKRKSH